MVPLFHSCTANRTRVRMCSHENMDTRHIAALFLVGYTGEPPRYPSADEQVKRKQCVHTALYTLKDLLLSRSNHSQRKTHILYDSIYVKKKADLRRQQLQWLLGAGGGRVRNAHQGTLGFF